MLFIDLKPKELLDIFIDEYKNIRDISNKDIEEIKKFLVYTKTRKISDTSENITEPEEIRWSNSLKLDTPDYSVYSSYNYYKEVFCCYIVYSRDYIKRLIKTKINNSDKIVIDYIKDEIRDKTVVDLGNGIGYSTASLSSIFKNNKVIGTNIKVSEQYKFNKIIKDKYNFNICTDIEDIDNIGVVFASEYFEHIERPFEHLLNIINSKSPNFFIIANSFNKIAVGHFREYKYFNDIINESKAQRLFISILNEKYKRIDAEFWNNTPMVYELKKDIK